jgi:hypothetical protein
MKRIVLVKIGGREVHLLRLLGILIMTASVIFMISSTSDMFFRVKQIENAMSTPAVANSVFGVSPSDITIDLMIGYFLVPMGWLIVELGVLIIGAMVYKSGNMLLPLEEVIKGEEGSEIGNQHLDLTGFYLSCLQPNKIFYSILGCHIYKPLSYYTIKYYGKRFGVFNCFN